MSDVDEQHSAVAAEDENEAAEDSEELEGGQKIYVRRKAEWLQVGHWNKEGLSVEDIDARILEVATEQLKPYIPDNLVDRHPLNTDLHGWKRKEVYCAHKVDNVTTYRCLLAHRTNCESMLRVIRGLQTVVVEVKHPHNADSHSVDSSKKLKHGHISAIMATVKADPSLSSTAIRRQVATSVEVPFEMTRNVQHLVRQQRKTVIASELQGIELDGSFGSFVALKESMWFQSAIQR